LQKDLRMSFARRSWSVPFLTALILSLLQVPRSAQAPAPSAFQIVTGAGWFGSPRVRVFDAVTGAQASSPVGSFFAYDPSFFGGVRVASCDFNGDAIPDIVTGAGPTGGPHVQVFDGATGGPIASFFAYEPFFAGGIFVACGDVTGDGTPDIITAPDAGGGPRVRVFDGVTGTPVSSSLGSFYAYEPSFAGGVTVAACDVNGDGRSDVVTGKGPGSGPQVRVFDAATGAQLASPIGAFDAYAPFFAGGVFVACGDVTGDHVPDIVTGPGFSGGPNVRVFDGVTGAQVPGPLGSFFAYDPFFAGGVRVAACDLTGDGLAEIVTAPGFTGGPHVKAFDGATGNPLPGGIGSFFAYDPLFAGGVYVGCPASLDSAPRLSSSTPANGATDVAASTDIVVQFSEPVDVTSSAFALACPTGSAIPLTNTTASPSTQFTLHPTTPMPLNTTCTLTVTASQVTDVDTIDPPDAMPANATVSFTTSTCAPLTISPTTVPGGTLGFPYAPVTFTQTGGTAPITWTISTGALPSGMALAPTTGILSGTPTQAGTFPITVLASASGGCSGSVSMTLTIAAAPNQAPSFVVGANQTVLEDAGAQTVASWASSISPGPAGESGQTVTFNITGNTNAALFSSGPAVSPTGTLTYTPAANANGSATITLTLQDNGGTAGGGVDTSAPQTFIINVTAVNDAPSFVGGANQIVTDNAGPQTVANWATSISAGPADEAAQALTFVVNSNTNPALFTAQPAVSATGALTFTPALDANGTATITLVLQDNGGTANGGVDTSAAQTFTISVTPVNDPPTAFSDTGTTDEDTVLNVPAPGVLANDLDPDLVDIKIVSAVNGASANVGTQITLASGALLTVNANGSYVYNPIGVAAFQALGQGQTATDSFTYTMQDAGGLMSSATVTITITGVNDVPALDLDLDDDGGTPPTTGSDFAITFPEHGAAQFIEDEADATITDVDSPNLTSITVTITNVLDALQEKLDVDLVTGGFAANFTKNFDESTPGVAVLTITATTPQPLAAFNTLLRRVTYQNIDTSPDTTAPRTITFVVNDGVGTSNTATTTVTIGAVDDPPTAVNDGYTVAEGGTLTIAAPGVLVNDTDPEGDALTAVLDAGPANATAFTLNNDGSFTYTHNGSETTTDSFTYHALANGLSSAIATVTITITAVNDAPVITAGGTLNFIEGSPATAIDGTILVTDADSTNLVSATVVIAGNYVNGQDILALPLTAGITGLFTPATGTLTLTGSATVAAYQAALRTVTYFNNSGTPSVAPRTVTWVVNDGTLSSNIAASTITVTAVNSAPIGVADAWTTFGNTDLVVDQAGPTTPFVADTTPSTFGVLDNDTDPEGDARVVSGIVGCVDTTAPFTCATTAGGSVTMESNGKFTYRPQAGDTGADSFQYVLTDVPAAGAPASVNVTVNLTLQERIWYVDGDVAGPGTGTSSDPFSALPATAGDADDFIFVHNSTLTGNITLQNGQKLYGEAFGLSINQSLNGNPAPVVLVAPGGSPTINATTGNAVGVLANTASGNLTNIEIRGLTLSTTAATSNAIDVTSANAANVAVTISGVTVTGATAEGIDINQGSTGTATVSITNVTVTSTGNGIDLNETAGTLTVTGFNGITITGNTGGSGIVVANATFDATAGGAYNQVAGGTTAIGDSGNPVGGAGVVLTNVSGDLAFTDLDIFATTIGGLVVSGTGAVNAGAGTGTLVSVASGGATLQSIGGPVLDITNATVDLPLASASVTSSPTTGISLVNVASGTTAASVSAASGSITSTTGISVNVSGGTVSLNYGGNITQTNNVAMVSVSGGHTTGTITFSGTLNATNGTGLQFDNADSTTSYNFTGTTTLNGGDAGIDITGGSAGTFTFGTGTTITNPSGTAFLLSGSNANVTYSGSISDNTGFAVDISGHAAGTVTFQTGSITSTGTGLQVSNNTGGTINFNSPTIALTTGANKAVTLDVGNVGGTINFAPAGGGNGLDISTTTGTGFSALGGGTIAVTGAGNTINATGAMAIEIQNATIGAGGVTFTTTTSGGGVRNVKLTGATGGAIALGGGTLTGATGAAFLVGDGAGGASAGGTSAITYGGTITSTGAARAVDIQDRAAGAGNITLSGTITHASGNANVIFLDQNAAGTITFSGANSVLNGGTSTAVSLTNNTGATITFNGGGLDIDATSGGGFVATGGGTLAVTGAGNTITTTTGIALSVSSTTIGGSGLTFQSISANGATNGIVLNTTGSGALIVTGNSAGNCGGTVTVSADGTLVSNVNGFTLARSLITDASGAAGDRGIEMGDFSTGTPVNGTITISNSTIGPTPHDNFGIGIASGTSGWSISNTVFTGSVQNSGLNFEIRNATVTSFVIDGSVFQNQFADGMQMQPASGVSANMTATIQNSTFTGNNLHLDLNHDGTGTTTYRVLNNTFRSAQSHALNFFSSAVQAPGTGGTLNGRFEGNVIGSAAIASSGSVLGNGIRININGGVAARVLLNSNTIRQLPNGRGIEVISRNGTGGADVTVTNNQVNNDFVTTPENGGFALASLFMQSNCVTVCNTLRADVRTNTVPATPPNGELLAAQLALIETGASTLQLVDTGAASASCSAQLTETNTGSASANAGCSLIPGPINIPP
jgi:hypothetical protein